MQALLLIEGPKGIQLTNVQKPEPGPDQALVQLKAAALNRRDEWCRQGMYPGIKFDTILGSDGAGLVEEVGSAEHQEWVGQEVVLNPNINWGDNPSAQGRDYTILGMPQNGTFAEYIVVPIDRLQPKPKHLDFAAAAAVPLAGLTAYRAVFTQGMVASGQKVLITGVGGGVAQFCFQFALAAGAEVYVTSGSEEKLNKARTMGAAGAYDYKQEDWLKQLSNDSKGIDLVVDSSGGDQFGQLPNVIKPGGRLVFFGASNGGPSRFDLFKVFWKQITLQGTSMGTDQEFEDMLNFVSQHGIVPIVDSVRPLADIVQAFDLIRDSQQFGKLVVEI